jgi:hypothetical protein
MSGSVPITESNIKKRNLLNFWVASPQIREAGITTNSYAVVASPTSTTLP